DARAALDLARKARAAGLGRVTVLVGRDPAALVRELPVVPQEELLSSPVPAVTPEGVGFDPQRGALRFAGGTAEAVWAGVGARRRGLAAEVEELEAQAARPVPEEAYTVVADPTVRRLLELAEALTGALDVAGDRFEAPLRARADAGSTRT